MSEATIPPRSAIPIEQTWNAESVFPDAQAWEHELQEVAAGLDCLSQFRGHLADSPELLLEGLHTIEDMMKRMGKVYLYAGIAHQVDLTDQTAVKMDGKAQGLMGQVFAAISFLDPELLAIGQDKLETWIEEHPDLAVYRHYFEDLFRKQAHVRSAEVEEIMGLLGDPFTGTSSTWGLLTNADFRFKPGKTSQGQEVPVTSSTITHALESADRQERQTAWESHTDEFLAHKNTLASLLSTSIRQNVFNSRVRKHPSTLEATLFTDNIPVQVFHNLIDTFRKNLPTWHRYWALRRKALGVDELHPYDQWAPLIADSGPVISFPEAVEQICKGLAPMGLEYVETVRRGCLEQRWVDYPPNLGKTAGAFSSGWPGTFPFIVMSFSDNIFSLSTLAHELGHSMHSYLTWKTQPMIYTNYSLFVAEVASNFHQAMVRAYLLENNPDPVFQINVIQEAMSNFHRYFFIMPTLARFELETHQRIERGEGLTADEMIELMADLFAEAYGSEMHIDRPRVGVTWATFGHLYSDYYVYQYATGISAAHALSNRILSRQPNAVEDYLGFLKSGSSDYPLEVLKRAGVDLTTPEPVDEAFKTLNNYVDRLEKLLG